MSNLIQSSRILSLFAMFRQAARSLRRTPLFTAAAILTLALGAGGAIAVFSILHGALLKTPPYPESERLHVVRHQYPDGLNDEVSAVLVREMAESAPEVESLGVYARDWRGASELEMDGRREKLLAIHLDQACLELSGSPLALGQPFRQEHYQSGEGVILSHAFWKSRLGADPGVIGKSLSLFEKPQTILGVLKASFEMPLEPGMQILRPLTPLDPVHHPGNYMFTALARLRPGVPVRAVEARFLQTAQEQVRRYPKNTSPDMKPVLTPYSAMLREKAGVGFELVCGASMLLFLLAAVNVASLFVNRSEIKKGEMALRLSLGARIHHLLAASLPETLIISLSASLLGLCMAAQLRALAHAWMPSQGTLHGLHGSFLNMGVVLFTLSLVLLLGLALGLLPLINGRKRNLDEALRQSAGSNRATGRVRDGLVVLQLALATLLLFGTGVLGRSLYKYLKQDVGIPTQGLQIVDLELRQNTWSETIPDQVGLLESLRSRQGIEGAALATSKPTAWRDDERHLGWRSHHSRSNGHINVSKTALELPDSRTMIGFDFVSDGYLSCLKLPLLQGRDFTKEDIRLQRKVCILDEQSAARFFPEGALGKPFYIGAWTQWIQEGEAFEIIGVIKNFRAFNPARSRYPFMLLPASLCPPLRMVLRSNLPFKQIQQEVEAALKGHFPEARVAKVMSLQELRHQQSSSTRELLILLLPFGFVALLLAALGLAALMASQVQQRKRELGLRSALGATPGKLLCEVLMRAGTKSALGLGLGLAASLATSKIMESLIYDISARDTLSLILAALLLLATSLLAALIPALKAARVQPMEAMRNE